MSYVVEFVIGKKVRVTILRVDDDVTSVCEGRIAYVPGEQGKEEFATYGEARRFMDGLL